MLSLGHYEGIQAVWYPGRSWWASKQGSVHRQLETQLYGRQLHLAIQHCTHHLRHFYTCQRDAEEAELRSADEKGLLKALGRCGPSACLPLA